MTRFLLWPLCALISIGAGGVFDRSGPAVPHWLGWGGFIGVLIQPEQEALEPVPTAPPPSVPSKHQVARATNRGCRPRSLGQIAQDESGGDWTAQNPRSTASGRFQVLDSTWANYGGYAKARLAPPEVQQAQAEELYRLAGARPWDASC